MPARSFREQSSSWLIGRELREGKRRDMPAGLSQCDFSTPPQLYVKRRFDNPPLS